MDDKGNQLCDYASFNSHSAIMFFQLSSCILLAVSVNLSVALAKKCQMKVGLLDADVYGPNVPIMMKLNRKPEVTEGTFSLFLLKVVYLLFPNRFLYHCQYFIIFTIIL